MMGYQTMGWMEDKTWWKGLRDVGRKRKRKKRGRTLDRIENRRVIGREFKRE